jgi:hydroxyethylthiazole kinase-like uncharacterized protein yjeF
MSCCRVAYSAVRPSSPTSAPRPRYCKTSRSIPGKTLPRCGTPKLPRPTLAGNKYGRGHALIYGGYPMTGAARMAARAAARAGAGLTSIAVPQLALTIYASALTSIMVHPLSRPEDLSRLLDDSRYSGFLIGPGAGVSAATRTQALAMLATRRPVLLDADALTVFAGRVDELAEAIHGPCVLTPHDGEFARLFDATGDKLKRARAAARRSGAIIVLKGADTVIAAPDGRAVVNTNAPPTLATGGSGDVLGGMILGLLAQGMDAFLAAAAGVWLHGAAAADFRSRPACRGSSRPAARRAAPPGRLMLRGLFPKITLHSLIIVISVLTYVLTTRAERERRPPSIAIAWVLGMLALPYVVLPMYLFFGRRKLPRKIARRSAPRPHSQHWAEDLIESFGLQPSAFSQVRFHRDGIASHASLVSLLNSATQRVDICTYLVGKDPIGREMMDCLMACVRRGVRVRFLLDGVGAIQLPRSWFRQLKDAGVETAVFSPLLARKTQGPRNLRNHRKWAIADGEKLWAGGRNLAAEYFTGSNGVPPWGDLSYEISGPTAAAVAQQFAADWDAAGGASAPVIPPRKPTAVGQPNPISPQRSRSGRRHGACPAHRCLFSIHRATVGRDALLRARCQPGDGHAPRGAPRRENRFMHSGQVEPHSCRLRAQSFAARLEPRRCLGTSSARDESRQGRGVRRHHCAVRLVQSRLAQFVAEL